MRLEKKVKSLKEVRKDAKYVYDMQVQHHNNTAAVRRDDLSVASGEKKEVCERIWFLESVVTSCDAQNCISFADGLSEGYVSNIHSIEQNNPEDTMLCGGCDALFARSCLKGFQ